MDMLHQFFEHKAAFIMTLSSLTVAALHAVVPPPLVNVPLVAIMDPYVRLVGGLAAAFAGLASGAWYGYCFIKAIRQRKHEDPDK